MFWHLTSICQTNSSFLHTKAHFFLSCDTPRVLGVAWQGAKMYSPPFNSKLFSALNFRDCGFFFQNLAASVLYSWVFFFSSYDFQSERKSYFYTLNLISALDSSKSFKIIVNLLILNLWLCMLFNLIMIITVCAVHLMLASLHISM